MVTRTRRRETGRARRASASDAASEEELVQEMQDAAAAADANEKGGPDGAARPNGAGRARRAARRAAGVIRGPDGLFEDAGSVGTAVAVGVAAAVIESELIPGILIGAGAILLGKMFPRVAAGMRPIAKSVIRAGLVATDKARVLTAEAGEQMRDMVAEVQAERQTGGRRERPRARRAARTEAAAA